MVLDCNEGKNIFEHPDCQILKTTNETKYREHIKNYCNANDIRAMQTECVEICNAGYSSLCERYNRIQKCINYQTIGSKCTDENIKKIEDKCKEYGLIDAGGNIVWPCNENSIQNFENECAKNNIPLKDCTPEDLEVLTLNQGRLDIKNNIVESGKSFLNNVASIIAGTNLNNTNKTNYNWAYIIAIIIITISSLLSVSSVIMSITLTNK